MNHPWTNHALVATLVLAIALLVHKCSSKCARPAKALEPFRMLWSLEGAAASVRLGVPRARARVALAPAHDRHAHPSDGAIDCVWRARLEATAATGGKLFDASKFRLRRVRWADAARRDELVLELGLTSYKEYVGTNQLPTAERRALEADGARGRDGDHCAHLSCALGCEAVLLTADAQFVLLRRSGRVSSGAGLYNGPSGHPEPERARVVAHAADECGARALAERALDELFESVRQEIHEETNVPLSTLGEPRLIGAMCDDAHKPDVLFAVTTTLDAARVRAAFAHGAVEGWESDRLAFWPAARLTACADELPLTAVTRAALYCFSLAR